MRRTLKYLSTLLVASLLLGACDASEEKQEETQATPAGLPFPTPPGLMSEAQDRAAYILTHLYDSVSHIDTTLFASEGDREQFFADYFAICKIANEESTRQSMDTYFRMATPAMDSVAISLAHKYCGDLNSPMFDEGLYILVMEEADKAGLLGEAEQIRLADRKKMCSKNKVGEPATNFTFVLPDGKSSSLYKMLKGEYTLLVFYSPDCHTCESVIAYMSQSQRLKSALDKGLEVVYIYPFGDKEEWRTTLSKMPSFGTVGMDEAGTIVGESLYDLRATPSIYLLDKDGRVVLRDANIGLIEEYLVANWIDK